MPQNENDQVIMLPHRHTPFWPVINCYWSVAVQARNDLTLTLSNENTLAYVLQGREIPGGWVWQQAARFRFTPGKDTVLPFPDLAS